MLLRLCALPRLPHEEIGLRLTRMDAFSFNFTVMAASDMAGAETVKDVVNEAKGAEAATAMTLGRIFIEG